MLTNGKNHTEEISLYFHVPFCTQKCAYCHFYVIPDRVPHKLRYMEALKWEWKQLQPLLQHKKIVSIYFGGGTPALLGPSAIGEILSWMGPLPGPIEITLEANPENIDRDLIAAYASVGINRISIGVQTLEDSALQLLARTHSSKKAIEAIWQTAEAGIKNISIDLMYDLPGQTLRSWQQTLSQTEKLPITHLSLYNLTIEPHTLFFKHRAILEKQLPDPETSLQMYVEAQKMLSSCGFEQYEISAFAKNKLASVHNSGYWTARPFHGLGPSAFSYWQGKRFRNVANLNRYHKALQMGDSPIDFTETLLPDDARKELFVIQLRLLEGINMEQFVAQHGPLDTATQETISSLEQQGWLQRTQKQIYQSLVENSHFDSARQSQNENFQLVAGIKLTTQGILFYDSVASALI